MVEKKPQSCPRQMRGCQVLVLQLFANRCSRWAGEKRPLTGRQRDACDQQNRAFANAHTCKQRAAARHIVHQSFQSWWNVSLSAPRTLETWRHSDKMPSFQWETASCALKATQTRDMAVKKTLRQWSMGGSGIKTTEYARSWRYIVGRFDGRSDSPLKRGVNSHFCLPQWYRGMQRKSLL